MLLRVLLSIDFLSTNKYNDNVDVEGGEYLSPRLGRPKADNPKRNDLKVRIDDDTMKRLEIYCVEHGITKAEAIRRGIHLLIAKK